MLVSQVAHQQHIPILKEQMMFTVRSQTITQRIAFLAFWNEI